MKKTKNKIKCVFATMLTAVCMISTFAQSLEVSAYWPSWPGQQPGGGSSSASINHIDIGVNLTASLIINGEQTQADFTIGTEDAQYVTITADPADTDFNANGGMSTSTDNQGNKQIRIEGDFPVGTKDAPISYTVTLSKTIVTNSGISVPVTLSTTTHYWDGGNVCPGYQVNPGRQSGIDLKLNNGVGVSNTKGTLQIQKTIEGVTPKENTDFWFVLKDEGGNVCRDNIKVTVPAGYNTASVIVSNLDLKTYIVEESSGHDNLDDTIRENISYCESNRISLSANSNNAAINVISSYKMPEPKKFTVTFSDHDGTVINSKEYIAGSNSEIPNSPIRASEEPYRYEWKFIGWDKEVKSTVEEDASYVAQYEKIMKKYSVSFVDWNNKTLSSNEYLYEDMPTIPANPERPADDNFTYKFLNWNETVAPVTKNVIYTAVYEATPILKEYVIEFRDWNGSVLSNKTYVEGTEVEVPNDPERASDLMNSYVFVGWDKEVSKTATKSETYIAVYEASYLKYTVSFKNWDGKVISENEYRYNDTLKIPSDPTRKSDKIYNYTFIGWDKEIENTVTKSVVYTAVYERSYVDYTIAFLDWDGIVLSERTYHFGDKIKTPSNPVRLADKTCSYSFAGWDKEISQKVAGNEVYTAVYEATYLKYTVSFEDWNGALISKDEYHYNDKVEIPDNPTRVSDKSYSYTFVGWDKNVETFVTKSVVYTAIYEKSHVDYTIIFEDWNGETLSEKNYCYGDKIEIPINPTRLGDKVYNYAFVGWDKEIPDSVSGSEVFAAVYESSFVEYQISFVDWNDKEISKENYHYGDTIIVPQNPTRESDEMYDYNFKCWDKPIENVKENVVYKAIYLKTEKEIEKEPDVPKEDTLPDSGTVSGGDALPDDSFKEDVPEKDTTTSNPEENTKNPEDNADKKDEAENEPNNTTDPVPPTEGDLSIPEEEPAEEEDDIYPQYSFDTGKDDGILDEVPKTGDTSFIMINYCLMISAISFIGVILCNLGRLRKSTKK